MLTTNVKIILVLIGKLFGTFLVKFLKKQ